MLLYVVEILLEEGVRLRLQLFDYEVVSEGETWVVVEVVEAVGGIGADEGFATVNRSLVLVDDLLDDLVDIGVVLGYCLLGLYDRLDDVCRLLRILQFLRLFEGVKVIRLYFA